MTQPKPKPSVTVIYDTLLKTGVPIDVITRQVTDHIADIEALDRDTVEFKTAIAELTVYRDALLNRH